MAAVNAVAPNGEPSITRLATMAGVSVETARRLLFGMGRPSVQTVERVAAALRIDVRMVSEWAAHARSVREPYRAPAEADLLTDRERRAVTHLIRAITDGRRSHAHESESGQEEGSAEQQEPPSIAQLHAASRGEKPDYRPLPGD